MWRLGEWKKGDFYPRVYHKHIHGWIEVYYFCAFAKSLRFSMRCRFCLRKPPKEILVQLELLQ